jgi:exodeoxyribonuclease V alpha subunit
MAGLPEDVAGALYDTGATTLHRLLGLRGSGKPRHDRFNPLPHDMVVVDETSMVSLPLMARLLDAVRPDATLVLVGDPFQLVSVEAGAVLGEIVGPAATEAAEGPLAADIVLLERVHRFGSDSAIAALADAIRTGDADRAVDLLRHDKTSELSWVDDDDDGGIDRLHREAAAAAVEVARAAYAGDAEAGLRLASDLKVLCATRLGPLGVYRWSDRIETLVAREMPEVGSGRRWYIGRPIIITSNDYLNRLFNGDIGLVVAGDNGPVATFPDPSGIRELAMSQLGDVETWWAMTIHKSQGSEFRRVIVTLPPPPSPILTRELLYTASLAPRSRSPWWPPSHHCAPRSIAPWPELQALARSSGLDRLSAVPDQRPWLGAPGVTAEGPRRHPESASRKLRNRPSPFLVTRLI